MPSLPLTKAPITVAFTCDCAEGVRSSCEGLPFYKEHTGKKYCVLHYPGKEKSAAFAEVLKRKLEAEDLNFRGVWFPDNVNFSRRTFTRLVTFDYATFSAEVDFRHTTFDGEAHFYSATFNAEASFISATFNAETYLDAMFNEVARFDYATFNAEADFSTATFNTAVYFEHATFNAAGYFNYARFGAAAYLSNATFNEAVYFERATFNAAVYFYRVTFSAAADFSYATFGAETGFQSATFKDDVRFAGTKENQVFGDNSCLNLQFAKVEKPDRLSFHTLTLRPNWFVNVDARKFEFINVNWNWGGINTKQEVESLQSDQYTSTIGRLDTLSAHRLLAIDCRNLAVNAEENHRYEEASQFRYMAMEARRLERWRGFVPWSLSWWYWVASGYGERVWRAFVVLIGVWLAAAALYTQVGFVRWEPRVSSEQEAWEAKRDEVGQPLRWQRTLTYSLGVMTLQKPEPRPATDAAQAVVMLETILGPVQAALLALAIRRKFMR